MDSESAVGGVRAPELYFPGPLSQGFLQDRHPVTQGSKYLIIIWVVVKIMVPLNNKCRIIIGILTTTHILSKTTTYITQNPTTEYLIIGSFGPLGSLPLNFKS